MNTEISARWAGLDEVTGESGPGWLHPCGHCLYTHGYG